MLKLPLKPPPVVRFEFGEHKLEVNFRVLGFRVAHVELTFGRRW